jgi:putative ABC transport system substrate-binding protein
MKRRAFISLLGGAAAWPFAARGQVGKVYRVGVLEPTPAVQNATNLNALREGLRKLGYVEGQNLVIEYRSADGHAERFPDLALELVRLKVDVMVTRGTPAVQAAQNASSTTPIVMAAMGAPFLVVASLPRPAGNVTGLTTFSQELIGKRIELLKELVPKLSRLALVHNIGNPMGPPEWEEAKSAARSLGLEVILFDVRDKEDLHRAFQRAVQERVEALVVGADGLTQVQQQMIVDLAAQSRLPAIHPSRDFVEIGGLMAYAVNYTDLYLRAASLVDKIIKGAKPANIPIEQPTRFELVINVKTAKTLGLTVPPSLLSRADEVIE